MKARFSSVLALLGLFLAVSIQQGYSQDLPERTSLDDYIEKPDDSYSWKITDIKNENGIKTILVDMVSQHWRTEQDVNRTEWRHWLTISIPEKASSEIGMLYISGGYNNEDPRSNKQTEAIAKSTNSVVAQLGMIPNQTLIFHNDGVERREDDLIGYTWDQFLKTGDPTWPARNPMVKGAVRAMDTMTAVLASADGGGQKLDKFVVAGGSKRGWTTWLTGAVDDRVVGIIPIVIDVLNADISMRHHFACYGFWAPNVGNYVDHKIMQRLDDPMLEKLYKLVDPYYYRHRLTMPKLILNGTGDQFFLPDSSQFYWDDLQGEKYLRYVPNGDHGMDGTDAFETIIAFYSLILRGQKPPQYSWTIDDEGAIHVKTEEKPVAVNLWKATNKEARDFRIETFGPKYRSTKLKPNAAGEYVGEVKTPKKGWTAYFVELTYNIGGPVPLKLSTQVKVTPDTIPFEGKPSHLPTSLTLVATAKSKLQAKTLAEQAKGLIVKHNLTKEGITTYVAGDRLFINWVPAGDFRVGAKGVSEFLKDQGCKDFAYQLESGRDITLPPALDE